MVAIIVMEAAMTLFYDVTLHGKKNKNMKHCGEKLATDQFSVIFS